MDFVGYSTPIPAALEYIDIDEEFFDIVYPSAETLERARSFRTLPLEITQSIDERWIEVKASGLDLWLFIIIGAAAVLLVGGVFAWRAVKAKKKLY